MADIKIQLIVTGKGVEQIDKTGKALEKLAKQGQSVGQALERAGSQITGIGTTVTAITAPIVAAGGAAVKLATDFNRSFLEIQNLVGVSATEVSSFKDAVLELSGETTKAPRELADALFAVTSAGARGGEALEILERAAKASAIGLGDTRQIALAVTAATTAYADSNLTAAQATDTLVNTVKFGNLEASQLAQTLGRVTPIASQVGASFEDVGAFIATFTRLGGDAAEATTALRGTLNALIKPGTDAQKALAEVGLSAEGLRRQIREEGLAQALITLQEATGGNAEILGRIIPNVRAFAGVLAVAGAQADEFLNVQQGIREGLGVTEEGFVNFAESSVASFDQFAATAEATAIKLGDALAPALAEVLEAAEPIFDAVVQAAEGFSNLDESTQQAVVALTLATAAAGPLLIILGQLTTGVGKFVQLTSSMVGGLGSLAGALAKTGGAITISTGALVGLQAAAVAATGVIAAQGTRAIADFGAELRGIDDPIRDAVSNVGLLEGAISLLPDVLTGLRNAGAAAVEFLGELPLVGELITAQFEGAKFVFEEFAKQLSLVQDAVASLSQGLFEVDNSARDATVTTAQLAQASQIAGRDITDASEATRIINEEVARLREGIEPTTQAIVEEGDAAAATGNELVAFAANTGAADEATKKFQESVSSLAGRLGFGALTQEITVTQAAIESLGGVSQLSASGLDSLRSVIDQAREDGVQLTGSLLEAAQALNVLDLQAGVLDLDLEAPTIDAQELEMAILEDAAAFDALGNTGIPALGEIGAELGGLPEKAFDFNDAMAGVNDILSEVRGAMNLFGIDSDSALGKVVSGATKVFDTFNSVLGIVDRVGGLIGNIGGLLGGAGAGGGIAGAAGGLLGGGGGLIGSAGSVLGGLFGGGGAAAATGAVGVGFGASAAAGAGTAGATAGTSFLGSFGSTVGGGLSSLGSTLAPLFTNPFTAVIGGGIAAFFGLRGLFGGESGAEQAARVISENFGAEIDDELAQAISDAGGGRSATQAGLFLEEIFATGTQSIDSLAQAAKEVILDTNLELPAALESIGRVSDELVADFDQLGEAGRGSIEQLLRDATGLGVSFEGAGDLAFQLGESLVQSAQQGGGAFLEATNAIGVSNRETLEFLRNAYGEQLPASLLESVDAVLGFNAAVDQTAGGAAEINNQFAMLPQTATESVAGVAGAFNEGSAAITEGLQPVSELIANEIQDAGAATSEAVRSSFATTTTDIQTGLGQVASFFAGPLTSSADQAASAADRIADAVRAASAAAQNFEFGRGRGLTIPPVPAQSGFRGTISRDTLFQAHAGEFVNIVPATETRRMNFVSAQGGFGPGPIAVTSGGNRMEFNISGTGDMDETFFRNRVLPMFEEALRRNENEIVQRIREQIFEEVR